MRTSPNLRETGFRKTGRLAFATALALLLPAMTTTPARADTVLVRDDWSCAVPYSGELSCTPPLAVPPGGYLWIGDDSAGPTVFQVHPDGGPSRIGWTELRHGAGRAYTNTTDAVVLVTVTLHEDAPTDRCGAQPEHGFIEVRR
jgi:hypothetical protein